MKRLKSIADMLGMQTTQEDEDMFDSVVDDAKIDDIRDEEVEEIEEIEKEEPKEEKVEEVKEPLKNEERKVEEPTKVKNQTVVVIPKNYSESKKIANYIKEDKTVMVNLESLETAEARKILDFLLGAAAIKKSEFVQLGKRTYSIIPSGIEVIRDGKNKEETQNPLSVEREN